MIMADPDVMSTGKSIYEASKGEIFWRNFLAGFARGLGNFIFTILIFLFLTLLTAQLLSPYMGVLTQSLQSFVTMMNSLNSVQNRLSK